jgi:hypothetical protein
MLGIFIEYKEILFQITNVALANPGCKRGLWPLIVSCSFETRMYENSDFIADIKIVLSYYPTLQMWTSVILVANEDYGH